MTDIKTIILVGSAVGGIAAYLATQKGKSPILWFAVGFFGGLLGLGCLLYFSRPKRKIQQVPPPVQPACTKFWYYLDAENRQLGPLSLEGLRAASKEGKITDSTFVWNEDLENWKSWEDVRPLN